MQKVVTINLNGNAYQVDEGGYAALVAYLEGADRLLKDNPDRDEIVADLEQAIADKARGYLGPHKAVVTAAEVDAIIRDMGPVDAPAGAASSQGAAGGAAADASPWKGPPRRLYVIHEGAMLAGVCTGVSAYLHVDVTIVRIVFLLLALITRGGFGLAYLVLAFVIPPAETSEERAAAHGEAFNARELIDRAKRPYAGFAGSGDWRRRWRREQRAWRRQWRASRWQPHVPWGGGWQPPPAPGAYGSRMASGLMIPVLTVVSVLFFWFWAWAAFSLLSTGRFLGQVLPDNVPFWVGILALVCIYHVVAWPLHFARRRASYYSFGYPAGLWGAFDGLLSLTFGALAVWAAYHYIPEVREVVKTLPDLWRSIDWNDLGR
jgi:phage shock protein PspC (stress-responsive transcriptional regulator)